MAKKRPLTAGEKAARTRKRRKTAKKAVTTRKRRTTASKAQATKRWRAIRSAAESAIAFIDGGRPVEAKAAIDEILVHCQKSGVLPRKSRNSNVFYPVPSSESTS